MRRQETALAKVCLVGAVAALFGCGSLAAQAQELKKYNSNTKAFWSNPPADWFLGDETQAQKGQVPNPGQPTPTPAADLGTRLAAVSDRVKVLIRLIIEGSDLARPPHHRPPDEAVHELPTNPRHCRFCRQSRLQHGDRLPNRE